MKVILVVLSLVLFVAHAQEQIHLAFHNDPNSLVVQWLDTNSHSSPAVAFGLSPTTINNKVSAQVITSFRQFECLTTRYTYEAVLTNLAPSTLYYYQVSRYSFLIIKIEK